MRLEARSLKGCSSISAEQSPAFWALCLIHTNFSETHKYGHSPEPFWEHPGTMTWKTGNQLGIVPRMIPVLKWSSLPVGPAIQLIHTRKKPPTVKGAKILKIKSFWTFARVEVRRQVCTCSTFMKPWLILTLPGLSRAVANSKPRHCRKKVQNIKDLPQSLPLAYWYRKTIHKNLKANRLTNTQGSWNQDFEKKTDKNSIKVVSLKLSGLL